LNTSYYAKSADHENAVSIAGKCPDFYKGREYKKLAPKFWFFKLYKQNKDSILYTKCYQKEVLDVLDPEIVYNELGPDAVLLCWEKPGKFCHRHLVAKWFEKELGIKITEL